MKFPESLHICFFNQRHPQKIANKYLRGDLIDLLKDAFKDSEGSKGTLTKEYQNMSKIK